MKPHRIRSGVLVPVVAAALLAGCGGGETVSDEETAAAVEARMVYYSMPG